MNENNLIPFSKRSVSEARESGSKGGKKSGETRRRKRDMKAKLKMLLELPCTVQSDRNEASAMGIDLSETDNETAMLIGLYKEAKAGNVSAVREIRSILGKDTAAEELALKKKELALRERQLSGESKENELVKSWVDAVMGGGENE